MPERLRDVRLARLAGHAEMSTTQRYADMNANDLHAAIVLLGNDGATGKENK